MTGPPIVVVSALPRELSPLCERLLATPSRRAWGLGAWEAVLSAREVRLVATGCGARFASQVVSRLLAEARPACVISTGSCGALTRGPRTGHLVLAERVRREGEATWRDAPMRLMGPAIGSLSEVATTCHRGGLVTLDRVVRVESERSRLAAETGAIAADMESAVVAEEAERAGVPWLAVRTVLDEVDQPPALPYERYVADNGDIRAASVVLHALPRPWLWTALTLDAKRAKEAAHTAGRALTRLLSVLGGVV